jgi:hypothetical protein
MTTKKKSFALIFTIVVIGSIIAGSFLVESVITPSVQNLSRYTINQDGTVTPSTDLISRDGNTYTLTRDVNLPQIEINCSNIVFNGDGHSIYISSGVKDSGIRVFSAVNTTIKNLNVNMPYTAILMYNCEQCKIVNVNASSEIQVNQGNNNTITQCTAPLVIGGHVTSNVVVNNNIVGKIGVLADGNVFYHNNILLDDNDSFVMSCSDPTLNSWDNGTVGNYWSDYLTRYPNATEIGQTGVGNTAYVISQYLVNNSQFSGEKPKTGEPTQPYVLSNNIDHFPLMHRVNIKHGSMLLIQPSGEQVSSNQILRMAYKPPPTPTKLPVGDVVVPQVEPQVDGQVQS